MSCIVPRTPPKGFHPVLVLPLASFISFPLASLLPPLPGSPIAANKNPSPISFCPSLLPYVSAKASSVLFNNPPTISSILGSSFILKNLSAACWPDKSASFCPPSSTNPSYNGVFNTLHALFANALPLVTSL